MRYITQSKKNKTCIKIFLLVLLTCFVMTSFSSQLSAYSYTHSCHENNHDSNDVSMASMCFICDCAKKTNTLLRLLNTVDRSIFFSIDILIQAMSFLFIATFLCGLYTLISLKTRMNN